jgi:hypothetical protein
MNASNRPPVKRREPRHHPRRRQLRRPRCQITGPKADLNLGLKHFLNGTLVSDIVVDTSAVATDTIDYVATDTASLTATSTRTVVIEALSPPLTSVGASSTPEATASSTAR